MIFSRSSPCPQPSLPVGTSQRHSIREGHLGSYAWTEAKLHSFGLHYVLIDSGIHVSVAGIAEKQERREQASIWSGRKKKEKFIGQELLEKLWLKRMCHAVCFHLSGGWQDCGKQQSFSNTWLHCLFSLRANHAYGEPLTAHLGHAGITTWWEWMSCDVIYWAKYAKQCKEAYTLGSFVLLLQHLLLMQLPVHHFKSYLLCHMTSEQASQDF